MNIVFFNALLFQYKIIQENLKNFGYKLYILSIKLTHDIF